MAKNESDKNRFGTKQPAVYTVDAGNKFTDPLQARGDWGVGMITVPKTGDTPSIKHSVNLPATNNVRKPRKDPIPFDN